MPDTSEKQLSDEQSRGVAAMIREQLARRRISRQYLANQAKISISTLEKGLAPGDLGFYTRPGVSWIENTYLTLRPSFSDKDAIYAYRTEISWDDKLSSLIFRESERLDAAFTQQGSVSVPNQSGHIYLVTNRQGQYRLIIVARPTISGEMYGILTTLQAGRGSQLTPVATPIVLVPIQMLGDVQFGRIAAGHPCYEHYRRYLKRTIEEPFALFLPG
jgi:hypothetical protein